MTAGCNGKQKKIEKIINKKIIWQCIGIIILWHIIFLGTAVADWLNKAGMGGCIFGERLAAYYDLVVTISTILTAAVVFFYSIIDSRRMGITNRTIISYCVGSYTIPIWFMFTLIHLPMIRLVLDTGWCRAAAADVACVFILQLLIICLILISTSFRQHIKIISRIERQQLLLMLEYVEKGEESPWIYMVHHMESLAVADSLFLDKAQMIRRLLEVPLEIENRTGLCWEKVIYQYYYLNLADLFRRIRDEQELAKIYTVLYEFAQERTKCSSDCAARKICILINSAVLNAALDSETVKTEAFYIYYINECVGDEIRDEQIVLFYLFHELMFRKNIISINDKTVKLLNLTGRLEQRAKDAQDECLEFWEIWSDQYGISREVSVAGFYDAMCTLEGEARNSCSMLYIKNLLRKKER